jgi:hypothetical protein
VGEGAPGETLMPETPEERAARLGLIPGGSSAPSTRETPEQRAKRLGLSVEQPGVLSRTGTALRQFGEQILHHPLDTVGDMVTAALKAPVNAVVSPGVGEMRPDARLSKGGNSSGRAIDRSTYDEEHGGVTPQQRTRAGLSTVASLAFPGVARAGTGAATALGAGEKLADVIGTTAAGAGTGVAYNPEDPAVGALLGATLATALPGAANVAGKAAELTGVPSLARNVLPKPKKPGLMSMVTGTAPDAARQDLLRQLERGSVSLDELHARARTAHPDEMLLDIGGPQMVERAGGAVATPSKGSADIVKALDARGQRAPKALRSRAAESMGMPRQNVVQTLEDQAAERSKTSNTNFDRLRAYYDRDPQDIDALTAMVNRPSILKAVGETEQILRERDGADHEPLLLRDHDRKVVGVRPLTFEEARILKQAHDDVAGMGTQLSTIESGGITKTRSAQQKSTHQELVDAIDRAFPGDETAGVPSYKTARSQHADAQKLIDAHLEGQKFMRAKTDDLAAKWSSLSEPEREFYRKGALASIDDAVRGKTDGVNPTRDFRDDIMRDNLRIIMPSQDAAQAFDQYVERANTMHDHRLAISRNSKTASRLLQNEEGAPSELAIGHKIMSPAGVVSAALRSTVARRALGLSEQHVNALAPLLTAQGPELENVVQDLIAASGKQVQRTALRQRVATTAAVQGARKQP